MATTPYFVLSPNTILSAFGLLRGSDRIEPTPRDNWRDARVDVIIPALNEASNIALCLAALKRQTMPPRKVVLVDDGSTDATVEVARAFCELHNIDLVTIKRRTPIGKTPTVKRQARELDSDVQFILDADTVLESENYIARTVEELYKSAGVASVCGTVLPLRARDRRVWMQSDEIRALARKNESLAPAARRWWDDWSRGVTNLYREVLYLYLQRFIYRGQCAFFGTIANPVGCAVAYRRQYVEDLFDHFTPRFGDNLTNSEDIFIGFAMLDKGYRNVQLTDVYARTVEPPLHRLPRQVYLWSSSFLQSCYYFDPLVKSPLRGIRRALYGWLHSRPFRAAFQAPAAAAAGHGGTLGTAFPGSWAPRPVVYRESIDEDAAPRDTSAGTPTRDRRRVAEPYRQAFGRERTLAYGRPAGWILLMSAMEKVFFPTTLIVLILLRNWDGLMLTVTAETAVGVAALVAVMKGKRLQYLVKGILAAPIRYAMMLSDTVTMGRFALDVWVRNDRRWRK